MNVNRTALRAPGNAFTMSRRAQRLYFRGKHVGLLTPDLSGYFEGFLKQILDKAGPLPFHRALLDVVVKAFPGALSAVLFTFIAVMHL